MNSNDLKNWDQTLGLKLSLKRKYWIILVHKITEVLKPDPIEIEQKIR